MRNSKNDSSIGKLIMSRLDEMERSQSWLSKKAGCSYNTVNSVIKGKRNPSMETAEKIGKVIGVDGEVLYSALPERQ